MILYYRTLENKAEFRSHLSALMMRLGFICTYGIADVIILCVSGYNQVWISPRLFLLQKSRFCDPRIEGDGQSWFFIYSGMEVYYN